MVRITYILLLAQACLFNACVSQTKLNVEKPAVNQLNAFLREEKNIFLENKTIDDSWDIGTAIGVVVENDALNRTYITSSVTFKNCVFKGKLIAYGLDSGKTRVAAFSKNISFINCTFQDKVNFRGAIFNGPVSFQGSSFLKGCNFEECTFQNEAYFNKTTYADEARFQNSLFMKKANWMDGIFENNVSFQGAVFYNEAQFGVVQFAKYADFTITSFKLHAFFNYAIFEQQAVFSSTTFSGRAEFLNVKFNTAEFRNCYFLMPPKFYKNELKVMIDFGGAVFVTGLPDLTNFSEQGKGIIKGEHTIEGALHLNEQEFLLKTKLKN